MASYASAKLAVDVATEGYWKKKQAEYAEDRRSDQEESQSIWGFIGGAVGAVVAGPIGYAAGSAIFSGAADLADDAETVTVESGRFNRAAVDTYNDDLKDYDRDSNWAQVVGLGKDLAFAWVQSGGLEAFKSGEMDMTKWMTKEGGKTTSEILKDAFTGKVAKDAAVTAGTDIAGEITSGTEEIIESLDQVEDVTTTSVANPVIETATQLTNDLTSLGDFSSAFKAAREEGLTEFIWNGATYTTNLDNMTLSQSVLPSTDRQNIPMYSTVNDNLPGY